MTVTSGGIDLRGLDAALREAVDGEVRFDAGSRAAYSTDASNYRQTPIAVVVPRTVDAGARAVDACRRYSVPVLSRGGGTSLAGECCNAAVVIDWSKHCDRLVSLDPESRLAVVEPGMVLDRLNRLAGEHGLMFGPLPATHSRCTIGGMVGNDSCGSTAQAFGKTSDNVHRLEVLTYDGTRMWVGRTSDDEYARILREGGRRAELYRGMKELAREYRDDILERFPDIPRRVSGYSLDALLDERGFDVAAVLTGSESTLVTVLHAELSLVPVVRARTMVVFGFPSIEEAADAVPPVAEHRPLTLEGMDDRVAGSGGSLLPEGRGWLLVELPGDDPGQADSRAAELVDDMAGRGVSGRIVDEDARRRILEVREAALGTAAKPEHGPDAWAGWEDAAVPPARLGDYLRDFGALLDEFGYRDVSRYGHFGHGCLHCRIPFDLVSAAGIDAFDRFVHRAAELVVSYGGSLSGEHGDGQARGSLLPIMFGERVMRAFAELKRLFDPADRMNPGKAAGGAAPLRDGLRLGTGYPVRSTRNMHFSYPQDGSFGRATLRCVGIGACRSHEGAVMCPSYRATGEEEHSTRGRARLLFEMVNGRYREGPIRDGWRSTAVRDALDLCLSCKGCKSDCPVGVDMATYKAEFLSHHYAGRIRPASHYTMGWLPLWARLAHLLPRTVNRLSHLEWLARPLKGLGGIEPERTIPRFAPERFTDWFSRRPAAETAGRGDVVLWPDTFTNNFHPGIGRAAVAVLEDAGYRVVVPEQSLCCALTWISTGQLATAKRILRRTAGTLAPLLRDGTPLVGLEPSCTAVFRSDAPELCPEDPDILLLRERTRTLAELLDGTEGWSPPVVDAAAVVQPHCHQHAVLGFEADGRIMRQAGIDATTIGGCCGLAGNFGFERGHLDVSIACAEHELLPAVRAADGQSVMLADGFSCRTQFEQLGDGRPALHLAELLAGALPPHR